MKNILCKNHRFYIEYMNGVGWIKINASTSKEEKLMNKSLAYLKMTGELKKIEGLYVLLVVTNVFGQIIDCRVVTP